MQRSRAAVFCFKRSERISQPGGTRTKTALGTTEAEARLYGWRVTGRYAAARADRVRVARLAVLERREERLLLQMPRRDTPHKRDWRKAHDRLLGRRSNGQMSA